MTKAGSPLGSLLPEDTEITVERFGSRETLRLCEYVSAGMKGVVWRARDDLGTSFALKAVPATDYSGSSLINEMFYARQLAGEQFAQVVHFGTMQAVGVRLPEEHVCVVTEFVLGDKIVEWLDCHDLLVPEFIRLAEQLYRAIAELRQHDLCHDDLHGGNVLVSQKRDPLAENSELFLKVIDTGSIKRLSTRKSRLKELRDRVQADARSGAHDDAARRRRDLLDWKTPDDHLRAVETLLRMASCLARNYHRFEPWERRFVDGLQGLFDRLTDDAEDRRLDIPRDVVHAIHVLESDSKSHAAQAPRSLSSPFDYPSAEMILSDGDFASLFSKECPWLPDCEALQPIYMYGPRGCGKSSVLRWLSFKTILSDASRDPRDAQEIGVYMSCSTELRSRFWLLPEEALESMQGRVIRFFGLLLLEELFDTLRLMSRYECDSGAGFCFSESELLSFTHLASSRIVMDLDCVRLQGQEPFEYLKGLCRHLRWTEWGKIQGLAADDGAPDPALVFDICRLLSEEVSHFSGRHVTFLVDDYSNQRIPLALQRKLNQTISFAKQSSPVFKVSSEYGGVDLQGVTEGREVIEINCGERYTSLADKNSCGFLEDILNRRLKKAGYASDIRAVLGVSSYKSMPRAIAAAASDGKKFHYHGIDCVHNLCSGDLALALDLVKRLYTANHIGKDSTERISPSAQHKEIKEFSHAEVRKIKYIVPFGENMYDIVANLGYVARAVVANKKSRRRDKPDEPMCKTGIDVRLSAISGLEKQDADLLKLYQMLKSRAVLFTLETSRSRLDGQTERLQMRRIYLPAFNAPLKRDVPVKIDEADDLVGLLTDPRAFAERELARSGLGHEQLALAIEDSAVKPREE